MEEEYIVEPFSGALYTFEDAQGGDVSRVRKLPLSVDQLYVLHRGDQFELTL